MNETIITKEKLIEDVKEVIADAEAMVKSTADDLSVKAKEARAKLNLKIAATKEQLKDLDKVVREKALEGAKETDRVIRNHPYESIGIALGVGLLIGILLNRK